MHQTNLNHSSLSAQENVPHSFFWHLKGQAKTGSLWVSISFSHKAPAPQSLTALVPSSQRRLAIFMKKDPLGAWHRVTSQNQPWSDFFLIITTDKSVFIMNWVTHIPSTKDVRTLGHRVVGCVHSQKWTTLGLTRKGLIIVSSTDPRPKMAGDLLCAPNWDRPLWTLWPG